MDPISQAVFGASYSGVFSRKKERRPALIVGALGGMAADLDVLIKSAHDPLLAIEYHRQFTHSLIFIPVGGLIAALALWVFLRRKLSFWRTYFYATVGYATHGLLDACTSYGTHLTWPFTNHRAAWNVVAVVDPFVTLPLVFLVGLAFFKKKKWPVGAAIVYSTFYLLLGLIQRERASHWQAKVARLRGHQMEVAHVHPTIGNLVLWRSLYLHDGYYYVDAMRVGILSGSTTYEGVKVQALDPRESFPHLPKDSILYKDILRFSHFSDELLYAPPNQANLVGDLRYSLIPNSIDPLWAIEVDESRPQEHAPFLMFRNLSKQRRMLFFDMVLGRSTRP